MSLWLCCALKPRRGEHPPNRTMYSVHEYYSSIAETQSLRPKGAWPWRMAQVGSEVIRSSAESPEIPFQTRACRLAVRSGLAFTINYFDFHTILAHGRSGCLQPLVRWDRP